MAANCPKCDSAFTYVHLETVNIKAKPHDWIGVAYLCPSCRSALSVGIDPVALNADLLQQIALLSKKVDQLLRKG